MMGKDCLSIRELLCFLNICDEGSIEPFFPKVRDREDIAALRCRKSGVIFLSSCDYMSLAHYENQKDFQYWEGADDRKKSLGVTLVDDQRRGEQFKDHIKGKVWLDVGTGVGGILDLLSPLVAKTLAVEPHPLARESLKNLGYEVYPSIKDVPGRTIEVVTLFHVLEHFVDPIGSLREIKERMKAGGMIIVEVPHAKDFLMNTLDNEAFKAFTLWSEHLILHTRKSLEIFLKEAGFRNIAVEGFQRYHLANHLYWLAKGKPGGHVVFSELASSDLDKAYSDLLKKIDQTDTLIAVAEA